MTASVIHPSVIWAQRKNCVFLTICLDDCKDPEIKMEKESVYFKGKGGAEQKEYEAKLELAGSIDPTTSVYFVRPRNIEFCLKKEEEGFWSRLTKGTGKTPWIKIDFDKWKDEDDSEDELGGGGGEGGDFEEMMRQMGGLGGMGGMGGMGGLGGMGGMGDPDLGGGDAGRPNLNDLDGNETDSDDGEGDDKLPDLE